jgi:predicted ATPase
LTGLAELSEALGHAGRIAEGLALVEAGIQQSEGGWLTPELLRVKGELVLLRSTPAVTETAEDLFRQALDGARRQETLSWELRAATSLARLLRNQGRPVEAMAFLQRVYDRFTEGFDTADLQMAKRLLDDLVSEAVVSPPCAKSSGPPPWSCGRTNFVLLCAANSRTKSLSDFDLN